MRMLLAITCGLVAAYHLSITRSATIQPMLAPQRGQSVAVAADSPASVPQVVVTGSAPGAPAGCNGQDVANRLAALFDAISRGDATASTQFFGLKDGEPFEWYSMNVMGGLPHFVAFRLVDLKGYLAQRAQRHERLALTAIQINYWDGWLVHFGPLEALRSADDLPGARYRLRGKGAMQCEGKVFAKLSLAPTTD